MEFMSCHVDEEKHKVLTLLQHKILTFNNSLICGRQQIHRHALGHSLPTVTEPDRDRDKPEPGNASNRVMSGIQRMSEDVLSELLPKSEATQ